MFNKISCTSYYDELSNKARYPQYYQFLPAESDIVHGLIQVIRHYAWRRVALLIEAKEWFIKVSQVQDIKCLQ